MLLYGNTKVMEAMREAVDREIDAYAHGHDRPLREYAAAITAYAGVVGIGVALGRWRGVRLPERVRAGDLALAAVATHRLSRLISKDAVTSVVRAPFTRYEEPAGAGEVNEEVRGSGLRHAAGELISCPFCLDQWVATAFVGGLVAAPRVTRVVASVFTTVALADVLQFAYAALQKSE
jgi:uncharacterized protein DUF1360